jgi:hypothetical protein
MGIYATDKRCLQIKRIFKQYQREKNNEREEQKNKELIRQLSRHLRRPYKSRRKDLKK